jgi:hypothetical protein
MSLWLRAQPGQPLLAAVSLPIIARVYDSDKLLLDLSLFNGMIDQVRLSAGRTTECAEAD